MAETKMRPLGALEARLASWNTNHGVTVFLIERRAWISAP